MQRTTKTGRPTGNPEVRNAIRSVALDIFAEQGFDATSIGEIADRAAIPKANVLYYYGSKDNLWCEAVDRLFADVDAFYKEHWPSSHDTSVEAFTRSIEVYLEACRRWPAYVRIPNLEGHADTWRMRRLAGGYLKRHIGGIREYYLRLIEAGILPDVDPMFLQTLVAGGGQLLLGQYDLWRIASESTSSPEEVARSYAATLVGVVRRI